MDLLECLREILAGQLVSARILADWLEDNCSGHREFAVYHKRLLKPEKLRLQTLLDVILKFGPKKQRSTLAKMVRRLLRDRRRINKKGIPRSFFKNPHFFRISRFVVSNLLEQLDTTKVQPSL